MIISISGAQSTGKSTAISTLKSCGFNVHEHSSARAVLDEMGISLDILYGNYPLIMEFQNKLFEHKLQLDIRLASKYELVFVERSLLDLAANAIALYSSDESPIEFNEWLDDYISKIKAYQWLYDYNFMLPPNVFPHVNDGVRASKETQSHVNYCLMQLFEDTDNYTVLKSEFIDERIDEIIKVLTEQKIIK